MKTTYIYCFILVLTVGNIVIYQLNVHNIGKARKIVEQKFKVPFHQVLKSDKLETNGQEISNRDASEDSQFTIAWYSPFHGQLKRDFASVNMSTCEFSNCKLMRQYLTAAQMVAGTPYDAILVQGARILKTTVKRGDSNQVLVFVNLEAPNYLHTHVYRFWPWESIFNWTMTYRLDSDIVYSYGNYSLMPTNNSPTLVTNWLFQTKENQEDVTSDGVLNASTTYSSIFRQKRKFAAWIVSHCRTNSEREVFVRQLQKFVDVDIYGKCSGVECDNNRCLKTIANDYKFYLSFENCLCKDYVTEKSFYWLDKDIITVVRGPATLGHILPDGTYINAADFPSAEDLAKYLVLVGNNEAMFNTFLKEKRKYVIRSQTDIAQTSYCKLCKMLNNKDIFHKTYPSMGRWWNGNNICRLSRLNVNITDPLN